MARRRRVRTVQMHELKENHDLRADLVPRQTAVLHCQQSQRNTWYAYQLL